MPFLFLLHYYSSCSNFRFFCTGLPPDLHLQCRFCTLVVRNKGSCTNNFQAFEFRCASFKSTTGQCCLSDGRGQGNHFLLTRQPCPPPRP